MSLPSDSAFNRPLEGLRSLIKVKTAAAVQPADPSRPFAPRKPKPLVSSAQPVPKTEKSPDDKKSPIAAAGNGRHRSTGKKNEAADGRRSEKTPKDGRPAAARRFESKKQGRPPQKKQAQTMEKAAVVQAGIRNPIPQFTLAPGLPVSEHGAELVQAIENHQVIIVCGETGSGKTTQLPKICLQAGRGKKGLIGHTQPRRIAASSIAKRIAQELNTPLGSVVGYKVRFTDAIEPGASIKLMTDGILLAETQTDPLLKQYDTIIIDEAHERSINIDFLLGYLKRLLPKRPDLKVIVTSATIDAERFAKHFTVGGKEAPIYTISGRTYPVEIRYRPIEQKDDDDDHTLMNGIADAVDELEMAGRGDILVFLPGEREIREAAETLRKRQRPGLVDILPLYARLSTEDQDRVFKPGPRRRIILATNVAETSITVPGIGYVVDTGLARVKRYSYRNKVEQLLIEPISKASANQRAGRCGRTANGICIRLYDENDFARRPDFTDPEIVRSNLAAVILRMKALKLGEVRDFPFVQAPPARAISDGYALLGELGAIDDVGNLTQVGRQLARLPIDPRYARMLLAASERGALTEALVIVAGLAVQDPRERPPENAQAADQAHKPFEDERSDFLSYVKIWNWYRKAYAAKKSNRLFMDELHRRFLSPRRMREWSDVWRQLCDLVADLKWRCNTAPATYEELHCSLLTGLLGNIGMRQTDADFRAPPYLGARGIHFWVWPGSTLSKNRAKWVMAAELVETSRLFARCAAEIEPQWVEAIGAHLMKKSWGEEHWEKKRGEVVALEKGTLYGIVIYAQRRVSFASHNPQLAREIFLREALVAGQWESRDAFFVHNMQLVHDIEELENKSRRPDVLVDDSLIYDFYDSKIPADVVGTVTFEKWRRTAEKSNPKLLYLTKSELMRHDAAGITTDLFPKTLRQAGVDLALSYHFEPGAARDGVTMTVPIYLLNQIDSVRCEWLVPGMVKEKVQALLKSLPQKLRRHCVPIAEYAVGFVQRTEGVPGTQKGLVDALIADIRTQTGISCEKSDFKMEMLPKHLIMNFKVVDENNRQLDMGRNLSELKASLGEQAQKTFQNVAAADKSVADDLAENITSWSFGELPELMEIQRRGVSLIGIPALVDRGKCCTLEVFDEPEEARRAMRGGLRRLFMLQMNEQVRYLQKNLSGLQRVQMQASVIEPIAGAFDSFEALCDDVCAAAIDACALQEPWPRTAQEFGYRKDEARAKLTLVGQEIARLVSDVVTELSAVPRKMQADRAFPDVLADVKSQLSALFPKHFLTTISLEHLKHYPRYAKAVVVRLDRLRNDPQRDAVNMESIAKLAIPFWREVAARKGVIDERLDNFRWLLEELRVSLFAQELRTPMPVSVKRLTRIWDSIRRL